MFTLLTELTTSGLFLIELGLLTILGVGFSLEIFGFGGLMLKLLKFRLFRLLLGLFTPARLFAPELVEDERLGSPYARLWIDGPLLDVPM